MRRLSVLALIVAAAPSLAFAQGRGPGVRNVVDVGQIIGTEPGQIINGWTQISSALQVKRSTKDYVTTEVHDCCVSIFRRGDKYLVARAEAVARTARGGVLAERIVATTTIAK